MFLEMAVNLHCLPSGHSRNRFNPLFDLSLFFSRLSKCPALVIRSRGTCVDSVPGMLWPLLSVSPLWPLVIISTSDVVRLSVQ